MCPTPARRSIAHAAWIRSPRRLHVKLTRGRVLCYCDGVILQINHHRKERSRPIDREALRHIPLFASMSQGEMEHVAARVAKMLLDQEASEGQHQQHRLTQQEMAALAGTAREVVGRALKELEAAGAIEIHQGRAVVLHSDRPRLLAST